MRQSLTSQTISRVRSFGSDVSGVVAIEFALIAPLLMLMTFGTFEISRALIVHKRFQKSAAMIGDLVSREKQLGADADPSNPASVTDQDADTELKNTMKAAEHAMQPYSASPLQMGIYQLRSNATEALKTQTKIEWSWSYHGMDIEHCINPAPGSSNDYSEHDDLVPLSLLSAGNAVIVIAAKYQYTPLLTNIIPGLVSNMTWSETMTFSPRWGSVFYGPQPKDPNCPAAQSN